MTKNKSTRLFDNTVALVPAAGQGLRLDLGPKASLKVGELTLIQHVVATLEMCIPRIIVGVPGDMVSTVQAQLDTRAQVIAGGDTRQATIQKLFEQTGESLVVVHDATRPFASNGLVEKVMIAGQGSGAASAFVHPYIPVGRVENGMIIQSFEKSQVMLPQSPQVYHREVLASAFRYATDHNIQMQTLWQIIVLMGHPVAVVEGEERNIKITTSYDWEVAQGVIWPDLCNDKLKKS